MKKPELTNWESTEKTSTADIIRLVDRLEKILTKQLK